MKNAFTMIELVFVIVVLGILAAIAVPKLAVTRDDAQVAKIRSQVASIRSAIISERQVRLLRGQSNYITALDNGAAVDTGGQTLFGGNGTNTLLQYPIRTKRLSNNVPTDGHWLKRDTNSYLVSAGGTVVRFDYNSTSGAFDCDHTLSGCQALMD